MDLEQTVSMNIFTPSRSSRVNTGRDQSEQLLGMTNRLAHRIHDPSLPVPSNLELLDLTGDVASSPTLLSIPSVPQAAADNWKGGTPPQHGGEIHLNVFCLFTLLSLMDRTQKKLR